jgi:hypothetical protein
MTRPRGWYRGPGYPRSVWQARDRHENKLLLKLMEGW